MINTAQHWHHLPAGKILELLESRADAGITLAECRRRQEQFGRNTLPEKKRKPLWAIFVHQFKSPLIFLLLGAAGIALLLQEVSDAGVILAVVVMNAILGTFHEGRAEHSLEALRRLSVLKVTVIRDGKELVVEAGELVPGDIVHLSAGDAVGADARILEAVILEVNEAALTGESFSVSKLPDPLPVKTLLADRHNMVYAGTHVTAGRGLAVVVATGRETEVGHIARLTESAEEPQTPLERRIAQFGRYIIYAASVLFSLVIAVGMLRGMPFAEVFMVAISQVVSLVPEGLPVAMTVALAVGVQRMAQRRAIVRKLSAVETLGSTTVICTDKTGTLTRNEMMVAGICLPSGRFLKVTGGGYNPEGDFLEGERRIAAPEDAELLPMLQAAVLCNDSFLAPPEEAQAPWRPMGDPTEAAFLSMAMKGGMNPAALRKEFPREAEIPFNSASKIMATQHRLASGHVVFLKGAPEVILDLCGLDEREQGKFRKAGEEMAQSALRLMAFAVVPESFIDARSGVESFRGRVQFLGIVGEMDPPRPEVYEAVRNCFSAGIRPVMVTGDHKLTGLAIAKRLGIVREGEIAVDGNELSEWPPEEWRFRMRNVAVFARVHPEQKLRIVEAFQADREVVAMTGDGVNDAPALARADVGVAMGITGTEVAKGASKIVITDDNFATIVDAVEEGRIVYRNLKKVILYLISTGLAEVCILLAALFFGYPIPLVAVQILWINLVTDGVVTIPLVLEPREGDEMRHPPVPFAEPMLTSAMLRRFLFLVPAMFVSTFGYFCFRLANGVPFEEVRTETFTVLAVCQWFNVLNCRSEYKSSLNLGFLRNYWIVGGLLLGNLLHMAVIFIPFLNKMFHTVPIPIHLVFAIGLSASLVLWVDEIRKFFLRRRMRVQTISPAQSFSRK